MSPPNHPLCLRELPYAADPSPCFAELRAEPWPVWLDSGPPEQRQGRYDILAARPSRIWHIPSTAADQTDRALAEMRACLGTAPELGVELPFTGGLVGLFSYTLGEYWEGLAPAANCDQPLLAVGWYDWAVVVDHDRQRAFWVGPEMALQQWFERLRAAMERAPVAPPPFRFQKISAEPDQDDYTRLFRRVQRYLREGDCYQVNLARRFVAHYEGDPWHAYLALRTRSRVPFGAYLDTPAGAVLSLSPERFIACRGGHVSTRPIKGTRPRHDDPGRDQALREALRRSDKDRAENLMIVDLLRNDLGKVCATGSVRVPELFRVESFGNVHHLVSTVTGTLASGNDALSLLRACLPGGSITGAPKRRAMEIIRELEPASRGAYCGAIGYIDRGGDMDMNIAIRTAFCRDGEAVFWAGGGIVADSEAAAEFQETVDKITPFLALT